MADTSRLGLARGTKNAFLVAYRDAPPLKERAEESKGGRFRANRRRNGGCVQNKIKRACASARGIQRFAAHDCEIFLREITRTCYS